MKNTKSAHFALTAEWPAPCLGELAMKFNRALAVLSFVALPFSSLACSSEVTDDEAQGQAWNWKGEVVDCEVQPQVPRGDAEEVYWRKWGRTFCNTFNETDERVAAEVNRLIGKGEKPGKAIITLAEATAVVGYTAGYFSKLWTSSPSYDCSMNPYNEVLGRAVAKLQAQGSPAKYAHEVYRGMYIKGNAWQAYVDANQPGMEVVLDSTTSSSCVRK